MLLSTILNKDIIKSYENSVKLKSIEITGLSINEQIKIKNNLEIFKDKNIFLINKKEISEKLNTFNFINHFIINKIFPSKIKILVKKADLLGITFVDGNKFYIGSNGKIISLSEVENLRNLPLVFGKFPIKEYLELQKKNK